MKINRPKDFWSGVMFVSFGLFFMAWAIGTPKWINELVGHVIVPGYQMGTAVRMGPAYFPTMLGALLAVLGAIILAQSVTLRADEDSKLKLPFNIVDLGIAVAIYVVAGYLAKFTGLATEWVILGATAVICALTIRYRPEARAMVLISAGCVAYGYLMKPAGLIVSTAALVFVSAFGGHEFKWKEVLILFLILIVFSWGVFVKGLTLPFPMCPDFVANCPIR
jgi:putative tricarboxylic transport membrane protein